MNNEDFLNETTAHHVQSDKELKGEEEEEELDNHDDTNDDTNDDDDDDDDLMTVETPHQMLLPEDLEEQQVGSQLQHQEKPWTAFSFQKNAILECLSVSIQAHNDSTRESSSPLREWKAPYEEWKPQPVPLPVWAMPGLERSAAQQP